MKNAILEHVLHVIEQLGLPTEQVLETWRRREGHGADRHPAHDDFRSLFQALAELRPDDPDLGLHIGATMTFKPLSPVFSLMFSGPDLAAGIHAFIGFGDLLHGRPSRGWTRTTPRGQLVGWNSIDEHPQDRHQGEFVAVCMLKTFELILGMPVVPAAVVFQHERPPCTEEHRRLLGCEPEFGTTPYNGIVLDTEVWNRPTSLQDPALETLLRGFLQRRQTELHKSHLVQRTRSVVQRRLPGAANLRDVARELGMSERSLQRSLGRAGTTFRDLADEVRREEAMSLLRSSDFSIEAVARLAGFAGPSSLHRAFGRWTGLTPDAWRDRQRQEA